MDLTAYTKNSFGQQESEQIKDQAFTCGNQNADQNINDIFANTSQQNINCLVDQSNFNLKQEFYLQNINIQHEITDSSMNTSSQSKLNTDKRNQKDDKDIQNPKILDKQEKNKICARKARERKKLLVNFLEQKVQNLEKELKQAREETQMYKQMLLNLNIDYGKLEKQSYRIDLVLQKIEECLAVQNEQSDFQLQLILDSLSLRKGSSSLLFKTYNDTLLKAMINTIFTPMIRHAFYIYMKTEEEMMQIPWIQKSEICQKLIKSQNYFQGLDKKKMQNLKMDIEKNLQALINTHKQLIEQSSEYQYLLDYPSDVIQKREQGQLFLDMFRNGIEQEIQSCNPSKVFSFLEGNTQYDLPPGFLQHF